MGTMKPILHFEVPGDAVPQPRHSVGIGFGGKPNAYIRSDHPIHAWRDVVAWCAVRALAASRRKALAEGPLALFVSVLLAQPKTEPTHPYPTDPGDVDNFWKPVADVMQKIVYKNDSHIINAGQRKRWAPRGVKPSTMVYLFSVPSTQLTGGHPSASEVSRLLGLTDPDLVGPRGAQAAEADAPGKCEHVHGGYINLGQGTFTCRDCGAIIPE